MNDIAIYKGASCITGSAKNVKGKNSRMTSAILNTSETREELASLHEWVVAAKRAQPVQEIR